MISQNVLLSQTANGQVGRVIVAHGQPAVLAPSYEPIHSAAVDLMLLLEGAIHDVAGLLVRWNVAGGIIRRDWQVRRKPGMKGANKRHALRLAGPVQPGCYPTSTTLGGVTMPFPGRSPP